jgi:NADPH:quinone reductase
VRKRHPEWYRADLEALFKLLQEHQVSPAIARCIGLEDVADAHRQIEAGGVVGKIVLCP